MWASKMHMYVPPFMALDTCPYMQSSLTWLGMTALTSSTSAGTGALPHVHPSWSPINVIHNTHQASLPRSNLVIFAGVWQPLPARPSSLWCLAHAQVYHAAVALHPVSCELASFRVTSSLERSDYTGRVQGPSAMGMSRRFAGIRATWRVYFSLFYSCLLYTSPSPRDRTRSRMPSSA